MAETIAILGAGNMGSSLLGGLIANNYPANKLYIADPDPEKLHYLKQRFQINTTTANGDAIKDAEVVILAVKPQIISSVSQEISPGLQEKKPLIISIAAGVRENSLQKFLGANLPIVRCMPNTPALIRSGASALFANRFVSKEQHEIAETILRAVGVTVWLQDEKLMDVVTALSGSGPAYFFLIMESLQAAAEEMGLSTETAHLLTTQTAFGAARMALESEHTLTQLRRQVTSPGGTTEQAVLVLEESKLRDIFRNALIAAKNRSEELAKNIG